MRELLAIGHWLRPARVAIRRKALARREGSLKPPERVSVPRRKVDVSENDAQLGRRKIGVRRHGRGTGTTMPAPSSHPAMTSDPAVDFTHSALVVAADHDVPDTLLPELRRSVKAYDEVLVIVGARTRSLLAPGVHELDGTVTWAIPVPSISVSASPTSRSAASSPTGTAPAVPCT